LIRVEGMKIRGLWAIATLTPVLWFASAQEKPAETVARPLTERAKKKQDGRLRTELNSTYKRWLEQDVPYIITDEERAAFHRLQNDEEREQFIEQFWLRRDPTPDTLENEYKEEHYRRLAYANEHFAAGIAGWRTDRGRIYIAWGPPDERSEHPSGGTYNRPPEEGGGITSTYPFEVWRYRHLEGIGEDINLEFVDTSMTGEYRLTTDPCEKDSLAKVPGAGPTQMELLGRSTRADRFSNTKGTTCGVPLGGTTESMNPFRRLEINAKVLSAPHIKFDDLKAVVDSTVTFRMLPMQVQVNYFPVTEASVLTYVTLQFENKDLQFQAKDGVQRAAVNVLGRVTTITRRPMAPFEATVSVEGPSQMLEQVIRNRSVYSAVLHLAPGSYRLDIAAKDVVSGNVAHHQAALTVPRLDPEKLQTSGIALADLMERVSARDAGVGQFVIGDYKVRPRVDGRFRREERLGIYCKVYNLLAGTQAQVEYEVVNVGTQEKVYFASADLAQVGHGQRTDATIQRFVDLREFAPGSYRLQLTITDRGQTVTSSATFTVL
jgi:GWxTD domain-containing protein